jgi:sialidase-1
MRGALGVICTLWAVSTSMAQEELWIHPNCTPVPTDKVGQFVRLDDGSLLTIENNVAIVSADNGQTWSDLAPICENVGPGCVQLAGGGAGTLMRTASGALVCVYMDLRDYRFNWNTETDELDADLDVWAVRSLDDGKTWVDRQKILDGYCGSLQNIIQTKTGHIVVPVQDAFSGPLRHVQYVFVSADDGATWTRSNVIDIGGRGDHGGGFEATVVELTDGRLWMLIRTNLDRFWSAYSDDHGYHWREIRPSDIDASSSPGYFLQLASGRIALAWNRLCAEGQTEPPRSGPGNASEVPTSWMRDELSIAFSEDDGATWTEPVVIIRKKGANLAYPYIFEAAPGELWVIATQGAGHPGVRLFEADFVGN